MWPTSGAGGGRQQVAERRAEAVGLVDLDRCFHARRGATRAAGAPSGRACRPRARGSCPAPRRPRGSGGTRASGRAARRRPPRAELQLGVLGRQQQPRLQLQQGGDQDQELGHRLEVDLADVLEAVDVGEDDVAKGHLGEADLLAQEHGEQQVERPLEDVEIEVELRRPRSCRHDRAGAVSDADFFRFPFRFFFGFCFWSPGVPQSTGGVPGHEDAGLAPFRFFFALRLLRLGAFVAGSPCTAARRHTRAAMSWRTPGGPPAPSKAPMSQRPSGAGRGRGSPRWSRRGPPRSS